MLKIKDNINLKELEKFGFVEERKTYEYWERTRKITIYKKDRTLHFNSMNNNCYEILYDLIKADIVEKVAKKVAKSEEKDLLNCTLICLKELTSEYGVWYQPFQNMSVGLVEYFYENRSYLYL